MLHSRVCYLVGHHRSRREARFDFAAQRWTSVCKHCGIPMARTDDGDWHTRKSVAELLEEA